MASEGQEDSSLERVINLNRISQIRNEIGITANHSYREGYIDEEAYQGYRELAEEREAAPLTIHMLETTRQFAKEHDSRAIRVHQKIKTARAAGYASENDENFLMEKLVMENMEFVQQAGQIEMLVDQKLSRMRKYREGYDKLAGHKLIKNVGYLKVGDSEKIEFPNEENFLKMTAKERKEFLDQMEKALPKAESYAQENNKVIDLKQVREYEKKLAKAVKDKIIGTKTAEKFMDGFKKIDAEEREGWLEEFDEQMERYEELWQNIRTELRGPALEHMEDRRDRMGYTELLTEFGHVKDQEELKLEGEYSVLLEEYEVKGIIGNSTVHKFVIWMKHQELEDKYDAASKLPEEMKRYEELWKEAEELRPKQREFMRSKIDSWGYTELHAQLKAFQSGKTLSGEGGLSASERALAQARSEVVKKAIKGTDELLDKEGSTKKGAFMRAVETLFRHQSEDRFNASSFEKNLRRRAERNENEIAGRGVKERIAFDEVGKDMGRVAEKDDADVVGADGFMQVEEKEEDGKRHRDVMVQVNRDVSVERFLTENNKRAFKSEVDGGADDVSFTIGHEGQVSELGLEEIRVMQDYMKKKEREKQTGEDMEEAA